MRRILFTLLLLALPITAMAQSDFGVWVNTTQFKTTNDNSADFPDFNAKLKFDNKIGYGISFNHFSGPNMSTEFAAHQLKGDAKVSVSAPGTTISQEVGTFKVNQVSAVMKWHFLPRSFISPYLGGGAAYYTGGQLKTITDPDFELNGETFKFENKFGFVASAGVNFAVTRGISVGLDGRYSPYKAVDKDDPDPDNNSVKLDPFTISLGLRFKM